MTSQTTTQFAKTNPLQQMSALEKTIALPHDFVPQRYPSFPALERTSVLGFNTPGGYSPPAGATSWRAALHRQATFPLWIDQGLSNQLQYTGYDVTDVTTQDAIGTSTSSYLVNNRVNTAYNINDGIITSNSPSMSGEIAPPYVFPLLGRLGGSDYTYVPANYKYRFLITTVVAGGNTLAYTVAVVFDTWVEGQKVGSQTTATFTWAAGKMSAASTPITLGLNTWIKPRSVLIYAAAGTPTNAPSAMTVGIMSGSGNWVFTDSSTSAGTMSAVSTVTTAFVPFAPPPDFAVTYRPWFDTRVTAVSALFTNVTKVMNKEGTVLAGRLRHTAGDAWNFSASSLSILHPAEKAMLPLESGLYTYCPPAGDLASFYNFAITLEDAPFLLTIGSGISFPAMSLESNSYVNCMVFTDSDSSTATSLAINVDWHIEFRNNSTLFPVALSAITLESYHQALLHLAAHGFFFSNEEHKSLLSKIIAFGKKMAPSIYGMLPPQAQLAVKAGMGLYRAVKPMVTTPPTTSAKASGLLGPSPSSKPPVRMALVAPRRKKAVRVARKGKVKRH